MKCQVRAGSAHMLCGYWIFVDTPAMAEAVGQLEDGQDQLPLCSATFLDPGLQSSLLDSCSV